ncbi:MAG: inositol monophosphatase, partial [Parachlamydiaceae bacterium]|nr:inositol monophosphatase [Parachlamydiaceae bacterium]
MNDLISYQKAAESFAEAAGVILKKYWGNLSSIRSKTYFWDLVTEADTEAEHTILKLIKEKYPTHLTLSEEEGLKEIHNAEFLWIIDPIDGTTNYTHQYPMVAVSIGLLINDIPSVGVVFNPFTNEMFSASLKNGATLNNQLLHVSNVDSLERSLLGTGFAYNRRHTVENNYAEFCHLTNLCQGVRRSGSAALDLAYVACGRLDGFWERGLQPWDMAAGILLISEAGGLITNYPQGPFDLYSGKILATNGVLHSTLTEALKGALPPSP